MKNIVDGTADQKVDAASTKHHRVSSYNGEENEELYDDLGAVASNSAVEESEISEVAVELAAEEDRLEELLEEGSVSEEDVRSLGYGHLIDTEEPYESIDFEPEPEY